MLQTVLTWVDVPEQADKGARSAGDFLVAELAVRGQILVGW